MCSSPLSSPPFQEVASHFSDWPFAPRDARGRVGRRSAARCIWKVKSLSIDADSEVVCIRQLFLLPKNKKTEGSLSIIFMQSSKLRSRRIIGPIILWQRKVKPAEDEDTDNGAAGEDEEELVPSLLVKDVRERWTRSGCHPSLFLDQWLLQVDEKRLIEAPQTRSFRFLSFNRLQKKLDQGALGMSDPCGTLKLALKPNSVPRNNCLLTNFYFCANWSVVPCQMVCLEGPMGSW